MNTNKITAALPTVANFDWDANHMVHQGLRCEEHPNCRWITKHAYERTVFYVAELTPQCDCPLGSLIVD